MTEQEILDNAPCETWTHTEHLAPTNTYYLKKLKSSLGYSTWLNGAWQNITVTGNIRCRTDIERIVEQDKKIAELEDRIETQHERFLAWRGVYTDCNSEICKRCGGSGIKNYANTATYFGGIGGQMITPDICDGCWGSGDSNNKFRNLRLSKTLQKLTL